MSLLGFGWRDVSDGLQQSSMVEPVYPLPRGELNGLERSPRTTPVNDLVLVKPVDRFCEGVVGAVADAADRRLDAGFRQPFGVLDGQILASAVAVMDKAAGMDWLAVVEHLFQGVQDKTGMGCAAGAPAGYPPG